MACRKFIDIGANLTDPVFRGIYHGKHKHVDDFVDIARRSVNVGMTHVVITGGSLHESKKAVDLCNEFVKQTPLKLYATVGCHPTRSGEMVSAGKVKMDYVNGLSKLISASGNCVAAIGEFGLDYDRLFFADKETQLIAFEEQFRHIVSKFGKGCDNIKPLPLFLHNRAAEADFFPILQKYRDTFYNGVVHSFTGSLDECKSLLDLGLYIGINGCSLKTEENLEVARSVPLNRLLLETDAPYCEIRPSHVSHKLLDQKAAKPKLCHSDKWQPDCIVRGRNEPSKITDVFEVLCKLRCEKDGISENDLASLIHSNTLTVFANLSPE